MVIFKTNGSLGFLVLFVAFLDISLIDFKFVYFPVAFSKKFLFLGRDNNVLASIYDKLLDSEISALFNLVKKDVLAKRQYNLYP